MRAYERSGVTIDQCVECRGIFLDRGEVERLIDAEASAPQPAQAAPPAVAPAAPAYPQDAGYPAGYAAPGYGQPGYPPAPRRRGFLDELFGEHHEPPRRHHGGHH